MEERFALIRRRWIVAGLLAVIAVVEIPVDYILRIFLENESRYLATFIDSALVIALCAPLMNKWLKLAESGRDTLAMAVEQAHDSIIITKPNGRVTYVNPSFERVTGYNRKEVIGKNPRILKSGLHGREFYVQMWQTLLSGEVWKGRITNKRKDGTLSEEDTVISPVRAKDGSVVNYVGVRRDITKDLEAEKANLLAKHQQELQSLMDTLPGVVWEVRGNPTHPESRLVYISSYVERLLGYTIEEWKSMPTFWLSIMDPEDKGRVMGEAAAEFANGQAGRQEFRWISKDGRRVWVEARTSVITDDQGRPVGKRGVVIDITERKTLEAQLRQAQKMEDIGLLAGGIAHDFNNLLTVILGYTNLELARVAQLGPAQRDHLEEIRNAAERAAALTKRLLMFGRKQVYRPQVMDLNETLSNVERMLTRLIGENIKVVVRTNAAPICITADPGLIEQVLVNLAVNSRDAMPNGGRLTIRAEAVSLRDQAIYETQGLKAGRYVRLSVTDTGLGMDKGTIAHMFEPFFTTKEPGKGTGLGLSIVYSIIRQCGGGIWAESEVGMGTTFRMYFPERMCEASDIRTDSQVPAIVERKGTVLLVEDEESVRKIETGMLERAGYNVLTAANADDALKVCNDRECPIEVLITDVVMPGMKGTALAKRVAVLRPEIKVLLVSGYTNESLSDRDLVNARFLEKPFAAKQFLESVRELVECKEA